MQVSSEREGENIYRLAIVLSEQTESQTQIEVRTIDLGVICVRLSPAACADADY